MICNRWRSDNELINKKFILINQFFTLVLVNWGTHHKAEIRKVNRYLIKKILPDNMLIEANYQGVLYIHEKYKSISSASYVPIPLR